MESNNTNNLVSSSTLPSSSYLPILQSYSVSSQSLPSNNAVANATENGALKILTSLTSNIYTEQYENLFTIAKNEIYSFKYSTVMTLEEFCNMQSTACKISNIVDRCNYYRERVLNTFIDECVNLYILQHISNKNVLYLTKSWEEINCRFFSKISLMYARLFFPFDDINLLINNTNDKSTTIETIVNILFNRQLEANRLNDDSSLSSINDPVMLGNMLNIDSPGKDKIVLKDSLFQFLGFSCNDVQTKHCSAYDILQRFKDIVISILAPLNILRNLDSNDIYFNEIGNYMRNFIKYYISLNLLKYDESVTVTINQYNEQEKLELLDSYNEAKSRCMQKHESKKIAFSKLRYILNTQTFNMSFQKEQSDSNIFPCMFQKFVVYSMFPKAHRLFIIRTNNIFELKIISEYTKYRNFNFNDVLDILAKLLDSIMVNYILEVSLIYETETYIDLTQYECVTKVECCCCCCQQQKRTSSLFLVVHDSFWLRERLGKTEYSDRFKLLQKYLAKMNNNIQVSCSNNNHQSFYIMLEKIKEFRNIYEVVDFIRKVVPFDTHITNYLIKPSYLHHNWLHKYVEITDVPKLKMQFLLLGIYFSVDLEYNNNNNNQSNNNNNQSNNVSLKFFLNATLKRSPQAVLIGINDSAGSWIPIAKVSIDAFFYRNEFENIESEILLCSSRNQYIKWNKSYTLNRNRFISIHNEQIGRYFVTVAFDRFEQKHNVYNNVTTLENSFFMGIGKCRNYNVPTISNLEQLSQYVNNDN